ncbi:hypothetical protein [Vibrio parahaemolyticus]|uniref:hypothetical protein n=1 Tax=Vibrio parahaemolyticus TaxID=670 RepID=UPI003D14D4B9
MRIKQSDKPQEKESLTQGISSKTHPAYNAALRGECRLNQVSADHFHHQNSLQTKNATRHESLLNALLAKFYHHCVRQFIT